MKLMDSNKDSSLYEEFITDEQCQCPLVRLATGSGVEVNGSASRFFEVGPLAGFKRVQTSNGLPRLFRFLVSVTA